MLQHPRFSGPSLFNSLLLVIGITSGAVVFAVEVPSPNNGDAGLIAKSVPNRFGRPFFRLTVNAESRTLGAIGLSVNGQQFPLGDSRWIQLDTIPAICRVSYENEERKFLAYPDHDYTLSLDSNQIAATEQPDQTNPAEQEAPAPHIVISQRSLDLIQGVVNVQNGISANEAELASLRQQFARLDDLQELQKLISDQQSLVAVSLKARRDIEGKLDQEKAAKKLVDGLINASQQEIERCSVSLEGITALVGVDGGLDAAVQLLTRSLKEKRERLLSDQKGYRVQAEGHAQRISDLERQGSDARNAHEKRDGELDALEKKRQWQTGETERLRSETQTVEQKLTKQRLVLQTRILQLNGLLPAQP